MAVWSMKRITRDFVRAHPQYLFVFGDNMKGTGYGGQAKEMRGEPNTIGVPTKWAPGRRESDYFTNDDFDAVISEIERRFRVMENWLNSGKEVVFPEEGVGTGLAELPIRAPRIHAAIREMTNNLVRTYSSDR